MRRKRKKHNYSSINYNGGDSNDISMTRLAKAGNKAIDGLMFKCVAVKKRGCRK